MNRTLHEATTRWDRPAVCELLRAVSGLVAIVTLTSIAIATTIFPEESREQPGWQPAVPRARPEDTERPNSIIVKGAPSQAMLVFYLVATQQQARLADLEEQIRAHEILASGADLGDRHYHIHLARDDGEEREAGQAMLQRVLAHRDAAIVELIDLRSTDGP